MEELKLLIKSKYTNCNGAIKTAQLKRDSIDTEIDLLIKDDISLIEKCYWLLYDISEKSKCNTCNKPVKFIDFKKGYQKYCSKKCRANNEETHLLASATYYKKTGYSHQALNPKVKNKKEVTLKAKYGVTNIRNVPTYGDRLLKECYERVLYRIKDKLKPLFSESEFVGVESTNIYKWKCLDCNTEFESNCDNGSIPRCLKCKPYKAGESAGEKEVAKYIKSLGFIVEENNRTIIQPKELDIVIPEKKIAIEYCGLYWHSNQFKDKHYHQKKWQECKNKGIRLITIFEDEWLNSRKICKDRLKYALGLGDKICYARNVEINELQPKEYKDFLDQYHIQGSVNSRIKLGAFYQDKLVAVMGFGNKRKALGSNSKKNEYELLRFATSGNIPGIGSKLYTYFERKYNPKEVISYCDLRWGTGGFYEQLGMTLDKITPPNYWYTIDHKNKEYRYKYAKYKLVNEGYDESLTEFEIMAQRGYNWIYDCGNKKFIKHT